MAMKDHLDLQRGGEGGQCFCGVGAELNALLLIEVLAHARGEL